MHDLSRFRVQLEERFQLIKSLEAKKESGVRLWKEDDEHIRLGDLAQVIFAVETNRKIRPVDKLFDGGRDFKIRGRRLDVKGRPPPWRDLLYPTCDPLKADWYVVVQADTATLCGEVVGMASREQVAAAELAPAYIAVHQECVIVPESELQPLPEYFYTVHALDE